MTVVVLPCLNEAAALPWLLARLPAGYTALVADNGSTDGSVRVAQAHGAPASCRWPGRRWDPRCGGPSRRSGGGTR